MVKFFYNLDTHYPTQKESHIKDNWKRSNSICERRTQQLWKQKYAVIFSKYTQLYKKKYLCFLIRVSGYFILCIKYLLF